MSKALATNWTIGATTAQPLSVYDGEDWVLTATANPTGSIVGWTITFTCRDKYGGTVQFTYTASLTDTTNGIFTITGLSADLLTIGPGNYVYDITRVDSGFKQVLFVGQFNILPSVTEQIA